MMIETLSTDRLILRKLTQEVYDHVFNNYTDQELQSFFGLATQEQLKKEKEKYSKGLSTYNRTFLHFQLIDKATNKIIGGCGYHTWYIDHARAEIGYDIKDESYKRKGLMSEAVKKIIEYGFNTMNLHRIEALVGPNNTASLKIINSMGFIKEGHLREHYFKNGNIEDSVVFSLLKQEYNK